jgi:thiol:disulfide interchange protein DsbC
MNKPEKNILSSFYYRIPVYRAVLTLFFLLMYPLNGDIHAYEKSEQKCIECHTLSEDEARIILKELAPDIKILSLTPGPINGLWEIGMESGGKKGIVYLDYSHKKIVSGNILDVEKRLNYTRESFDRINRVDLSLIPYEKSIVMGDRNARHKIVVFSDPD